MVTVGEIRESLTEEQNARYLDYQIEWWIAHKRNRKNDILKTINNQPINETRAMEILLNPSLRQHIVKELNRRCLNVYHIPVGAEPRIVVYINSRNKPVEYNGDDAADSMLLFMYFGQWLLETLIRPGAQAELVVDMLGGPAPTMAELKGQIAMFSGIIGRTFPKFYGQYVLCCNWGWAFRKSVMALGYGAGLSALILTPEELQERYTKDYVPTILGGTLDLDALDPVGTQVDRFFANGGNHRTFPADELRAFSEKNPTPVSSLVVDNETQPELVPDHEKLPSVSSKASSVPSAHLGSPLPPAPIPSAISAHPSHHSSSSPAAVPSSRTPSTILDSLKRDPATPSINPLVRLYFKACEHFYRYLFICHKKLFLVLNEIPFVKKYLT